MAEEANAISDMGGQLVSRIFGSILWFGIVVIVAGVIVGTVYYFFIYRRKFDIKVKINSNRSNEKYSVIFDKAAILTDRKNRTPYLRIWALRRDFPVPKYNVIQKTNTGDYIEMFRKSENEFYFLMPSELNKTHLIRDDGKKYMLANHSQIMVDPEMGFWAAKRKTNNKKMFSTDSILMKILPYVPQIVGGVITLFILYILMDTLPEVLGRLTELTRELKLMQTAEVVMG